MVPPTPLTAEGKSSGGLPMAIVAYLIWGLLPLYIHAMPSVSGLAFVGWRVVLTLPMCVLVVLATRQGWKLGAALRSPRTLAKLVLSGLLIGSNWLIYVWAIKNGHVFAASIGYYINPLVNVVLGTVFLRERLGRLQWLAVGIALVGVAMLSWGARDTLGISLALAGTFAGYGLVRKLVEVDSLPGLTVETIVLLPFALVLLAGVDSGAAVMTGPDHAQAALLALSGVVTAVPLVLFAAATRRLDLSTLGFIQYLSPTLQFLVGRYVYHEPLRPAQLACLCTMWLAIAVFSYDIWRRTRRETR